MSKEFKHLVSIEVQAMMSDDGVIYSPSFQRQANLDNLETPKTWCEDSDTYIIYGPVPVTTTCGVIRKIQEIE
jgi:hypothetical protein